MSDWTFGEISELLRPVKLGTLSEKPLVSLLTPNYNYGRYVGEAIESALAQTYTNFEMIVCDDGSKDNSCEIIEGHARRDSRVKLIRKENGGVATALNIAYRHSKGEIVCLLDADDRFVPEKLELVVEAFRSRPECGFLGHQMIRTNAEGRRLGVSPWLTPPPDGWYGPSVALQGDLPPGLAFGSGLCLRREITAEIFPLPERFRKGLDGVIMVLASLKTPVIGLAIPLAEYRCHGNNISISASVNSETLESEVEVERMLWDLRKEYLNTVHPRLGDNLPGFDQRLGTMSHSYTQARLQKTGKVFPAYQRLVGSEKFRMLPARARWFLRLSILMPLPIFRYAVNITTRPNRLKQWLWWLIKYAPGEARRRLFAS